MSIFSHVVGEILYDGLVVDADVGVGVRQGWVWPSVEWEVLQVFLCLFIACNVELHFIG